MRKAQLDEAGWPKFVAEKGDDTAQWFEDLKTLKIEIEGGPLDAGYPSVFEEEGSKYLLLAFLDEVRMGWWRGPAAVYDRSMGTMLWELNKPILEPMIVAFSSDGKRVFISDSNSNIAIWKNGKIVVKDRHEGGIVSATFDPPGTRVTAKDKNGEVLTFS